MMYLPFFFPENTAHVLVTLSTVAEVVKRTAPGVRLPGSNLSFIRYQLYDHRQVSPSQPHFSDL